MIDYFCGLPCFSKGLEIHPDFLRALILAKSNGDPAAVSNKNARGLTQIIDSTGREAGAAILANPAIATQQLEYVQRSQLEQFRAKDLHDPALNILLVLVLLSTTRLQIIRKLWISLGR